MASLEDQGLYALSANYGGLIARMLFQPIEISSRNLFANLCAAQSEQEVPATKAGPVKQKAQKATEQPNANIQQAASILRDVLHFYGIISLIVFAMGPTAAPLLLRVVVGSRWSDSGAGEVLGTYSYYIPFLAINGVSEAFVAATASTKELRKQSFWMAGFSALFAGSAWWFVKGLDMGAKGLVLANCVNMGARILFNLWFVREYFQARHVVCVSITRHYRSAMLMSLDRLSRLWTLCRAPPLLEPQR